MRSLLNIAYEYLRRQREGNPDALAELDAILEEAPKEGQPQRSTTGRPRSRNAGALMAAFGKASG